MAIGEFRRAAVGPLRSAPVAAVGAHVDGRAVMP
jgi:hypothetical protein